MNELIVDIETTGLNPLEHEIIVIGCEDPEQSIPMILSSKIGEKDLLERFWDIIEDHKVQTLVGFNVNFDWTFIKLRSLKHKLKIKHFEKYTHRKDMRLILNSDRYAKGKLKDYAQFFCYEIEDGINGDKIPELYKQGELDKIAKHCASDIKLTAQIWSRIKDCKMV